MLTDATTTSCGCPAKPVPLPVYVPPSSEKVTVKFKLDEYHIIAQVYTEDLTLAAVIDDLARKFKLDAKFLELSHAELADGAVLDGAMRLYEVPHNEFSIIELGLGLNDGLVMEANLRAKRTSERVRLDPEVFYGHYQLPVFFSVQIQDEADKNVIAKNIIVEIVSQPIVKSFVGGYRNTKTAMEYHDAFTQTGPSADSIKWDGIISRPTQTIRESHTSQDTRYDHSSQAFGSATELIYITATSDYTVVAGKYETHHDQTVRINKLAKVRLIQRNFRRYLWQKLIRESAAEYRRLNNIQRERELTRQVRLLDCFKEECVKKLFPKTRDDFNLLVVQIHKWKQAEVQRINDTSSGGPRIALLANLLNQEIILLNAVEKKYFAVRKHVAAQRAERKLDQMGEPVRWVGYKNVVCEMDLLRTQKIRFLVGIYREMTNVANQQEAKRNLVVEKVLSVLAEEPDSAKRNELVELLHREQNLLCNGLGGSNVEALRMRQTNLMVDIIHSYDRHLTTIPKKGSSKKLLCKMCKSVKSVGEFQLSTRQREANVCTKCILLKNPPTDFTIYRTMLRAIRRDERRRNALASFAFIAQENDIRELIDTIWHGHSLLSQNSIHTELRLPRWNRGDDWSPWNCVCLTDEEARAHMKLITLEDLYDDYLIQKVSMKHDLARLAFKKMDRINWDYVESLEWSRSGLNDGTV